MPLTRDTDGRTLLVNFRRAVVLHHFNFKRPVKAVTFSPDGKFVPHLFPQILGQPARYIAITSDSHPDVWRTPNHLVRDFAPFVLRRTYTGHGDDVPSITWSADSR